MRAYLNFKPELEHTGQESYVHRLQRGGQDGIPDVRYFPIGEAGVLESAEDGRGRRRRRRQGQGGGVGGGGGEGGGGGRGGGGQEEDGSDW